MVQGEGKGGSDRGRGDFKRMRLLPKFRFLRFLSRFIVYKKRESEARAEGPVQWWTPPSWGKHKGPSLRCMPEVWESEVCQSALGGYATLLFVFRFLFFSAFLSVFIFFVRLVLFRLLFCFVSLAKKHFNLQMRNKFQTKAQSFPLQINF